MNREIIPKLKIIIGEAVKEAKEMGDTYVKPEHIIIAIMMDKNNGCVDALRNLNVNLNTLSDDVYHELTNTNLTPKIDKPNKITIPFSKDSRKLFKSVDFESEQMGDNHIDTTHIMMAILNSKNELPIRKVLNKEHHITYDSFINIVKTMRDKLDQIKNMSDDEEFDNTTNEDKNKRSRKNNQTKTPVLDNFCTDITKMVDENKIDPVVGRSKEIKRVTQILSRRKKNNPVLIGEAGVGKSSIVEGIALLIKSGNAPRTLMDKKIYTGCL
jgi:ATP-dependent Clp protease ATP-binding subunit ClpC